MTTSRLNLIRPGDGGDARLFEQVEGVLNGQTRNSGTVTLTAGATSTTVNDPRFQSGQRVVLFPTTAHAAAVVATTYVPMPRSAGSFVITHTNTADVDKTFDYIFVG